MATMSFPSLDTLGYAKKLEQAGFTRQQAEVQAELLREQTEAQARLFQSTIDKYDEASRKELATKGDVQDVRVEIQDVRLEIEKVRAEVEKVKYDLLKWQIGLTVAMGTVMLTGFGVLGAIMAKGFGWLGF